MGSDQLERGSSLRLTAPQKSSLDCRREVISGVSAMRHSLFLLLLANVCTGHGPEAIRVARVVGYSRPKRVLDRLNETDLLDQVAELMRHVRAKDVGQKLNSDGDQTALTDDADHMSTPYFSVFPDTQHFDQIHVKIHRNSTGFLWKKLYLEDFYDFGSLWPQFQTTEVELDTTTTVDSTKDSHKFYHQIAHNLKNALPNLKRIKLGGGYRFESNNETVDTLINKLKRTRENILDAIETLQAKEINVTFSNYVIDFVLPEQLVNQLADDTFRQQIGQIFQPICLRWLDNVYTLKFASHEIMIKLKISFGSHFPRYHFKPTCSNLTAANDSSLLPAGSYSDKEPRTGCIHEVFEPNKTEVFAADYLYLEDFANVSDFRPQLQLETLNLSVSAVSSSELMHRQFYTTAVENLKRAAPNLKVIGFHGTLRMYPQILSLYELRKELMEIKKSMDAMSQAVRQNFDKVEWNEEPMFMFAVDKEILKRVQGSDLVKALEVFNYSELDLETGKISLKFTTSDNHEHSVNFLITALHPEGYSFY